MPDDSLNDPLARKIAWPLLALVLLLGVGFRMAYAKFAYVANFDTGTVSLMAANILEGDRPLFFYGQNYMGALEAYVAALFMVVLGKTDFATAMSTITFAGLWIWASYLLFTEIRNRPAGLVAALLVAVPGYWTVKYSVFPYGGYTIAYFCGTMVLWLALRIYRRDLLGSKLWWHTLGIGAFAGLGVWTHYLVGPFCLVAAVLCLAHLIRHRSFGVLLAYGAGAVVAVLGLVPTVLLADDFTGSHTRGFIFTGEHIAAAWDNFQGHNVKRLLFWDVERYLGGTIENIWRAVLGLGFLVGFGTYLLALVRAKGRRLAMAVPLVFILIFLSLFVPHHLAVDPAPRYVMTMIILFLSACFALGFLETKRWLRWAGLVFLGLFLASQFAGQMAHLLMKREPTANARKGYDFIAEEARKSGADFVGMITGDPQYMHDGQNMSFRTGGTPTFIAPLDERLQPNAQAFETSESIAWTCQYETWPAVQQTFYELQYPFVREQEGERANRAPFWRPDPKGNFAWPVRDEVPPATMTMHLNGVASNRFILLDRDIRTTSNYVQVINVAFDEPIVPHSLWITSPEPLPRKLLRWYEIWVHDGKEDSIAYRVNDCVRRVADSYRIGDRIYFKGYFPRQEIVINQAALRGAVKYLEIRKNRNNKQADWKLNELHIFTARPEKVDEVSVAYDASLARLESGSLDFIISDRQASARLLEHVGSGVAYPRYNTKVPATLLSRIVHPRDGLGVLVDSALARGCVDVIQSVYPPGCLAEVIRGDNDGYALLVFKGDWPAGDWGLIWNGHTILRAYEPTLIAWVGEEAATTLGELSALEQRNAEKAATARALRRVEAKSEAP